MGSDVAGSGTFVFISDGPMLPHSGKGIQEYLVFQGMYNKMVLELKDLVFLIASVQQGASHKAKGSCFLEK